MICNWSYHFGFVSLRDPITGEWHDVQTGDSSPWMLNEARFRKQLYRMDEPRAYRLSSRALEELWRKEHPEPLEEGIVEEFPLPDD
jgi:hypothetical protein